MKTPTWIRIQDGINGLTFKRYKMKTAILKYVILAAIGLFYLSSCLTAGLDDDLPTYDEAEVLSFNFEYRWSVTEGTSEKLQVITLDTATTIDDGTIYCKITVPGTTTAFTAEEKAKVTLNNIVGYCSISTAATIKPLGNSPVLGIIGDFSQSGISYQVTSADGKNKKIWNLVIEDFIN